MLVPYYWAMFGLFGEPNSNLADCWHLSVTCTLIWHVAQLLNNPSKYNLASAKPSNKHTASASKIKKFAAVDIDSSPLRTIEIQFTLSCVCT
jgi:hypothetical protein